MRTSTTAAAAWRTTDPAISRTHSTTLPRPTTISGPPKTTCRPSSRCSGKRRPRTSNRTASGCSSSRMARRSFPGVHAMLAPGHTVGHTIFMIDSGGKQLSYVGDLAHHPVLLLQKPLTEFKYDTDPKQSAQSRVKILSMLADNKIPLLAYHFAWPGIGHVAKQADGFRFYPEGMKMEL